MEFAQLYFGYNSTVYMHYAYSYSPTNITNVYIFRRNMSKNGYDNDDKRPHKCEQTMPR